MRLILRDVVRRTETIKKGLKLSFIAVILVLEYQVGSIIICDALVVFVLLFLAHRFLQRVVSRDVVSLQVFQGLVKEFLCSLDLVGQLPINELLLFNAPPEGRHSRRFEGGFVICILSLFRFLLKVLSRL